MFGIPIRRLVKLAAVLLAKLWQFLDDDQDDPEPDKIAPKD